MNWPNDRPGDADLSALETWEADLKNQANSMDTTSIDVGNTAAGMKTVWTFPSGTDWSAQVSLFPSRLTSLAETMRACARTIRTYVDEVSSIKDDVNRIRSAIDTERASARRNGVNPQPILGDDWSSRWNIQPQNVFDLLNPDIADALNAKITSTHNALNSSAGELRSAAARRRAADSAFVREIRRSVPEDWAATQSSLASIGVGAGSSSAQAGTKAADYLDSILELDGSYYQSDLDGMKGLDTYFSVYGDDPEAMAAMLTRLGPEKFRNLLSSFGETANSGLFGEDFKRYSRHLHDAFGSGSSAWDEETASQYVDGLIVPLTDSRSVDAASNIAYLFTDNTKISPLVSLLAARRIYGIDSNGKPYLGDNGTAYSLAENDADKSYNLHGGMPSFHPYSAIYSSLARFPEASAEFLSPGGNGDLTLIETIFGKNSEYGNYDGYEGALKLLVSASQIPGGPADSARSIDPAAWSRTAEFTSIALRQLSKTGASFDSKSSSDGLSESAKASLATALAINMPGFMDSPLNRTATGDLNIATTDVFTVNQVLDTPNLTVDQLRKLLGVAGSGEVGGQILTQSQTMMQGAYREYISGSPQHLQSERLEAAMTSLATLDALRVGSAKGRDLTDAKVTQEEIERRKADLESAVDIISLIPVAGTLVKGAQIAARPLTNLMSDGATLVTNKVIDEGLNYGIGKAGELVVNNLSGYSGDSTIYHEVENGISASAQLGADLNKYQSMGLVADILGYDGLRKGLTEPGEIEQEIAVHAGEIDALLRTRAGEAPNAPGENRASEHSLDHLTGKIWSRARSASQADTEHSIPNQDTDK